jgi:predicted ATPase
VYSAIDTLSAARELQHTAEERLAKTAHDLAKAELSIESPVEMMTARHESEIATTLARTADELYGYTLDILA